MVYYAGNGKGCHNPNKWNTVLSKKQYRAEKKYRDREWRLRLCTSFFISNLPDSCNHESLWKAFGHFPELEDVYVPVKRGRDGNKFGFIKLFKITDTDFWIEKLKEVKIDGAILDVSLAKFGRDGSKVTVGNKEERASVFTRLGNDYPNPSSYKAEIPNNVHGNIPKGGRSFRDVVSNGNGRTQLNRKVIELPPITTEVKAKREVVSLVGVAKDIEILNDLNNLLHEGLELSYLGGLKVLITFKSAKEADDFLRKEVDSWEKWFARLFVWEGLPPMFDRVAWIKVIGVPATLWDRHVFNKIGERCGRLLVKSEASEADGNLAEDRMAVLVQTGKKIAEEFELIWKDHRITVWVEEISGQWIPGFLNNSSSVKDFESSKSVEETDGEEADSFGAAVEEIGDDHSPARSPELGMPSVLRHKEPNGSFSCKAPPCMGNNQTVDILHAGCQPYVVSEVGSREAAQNVLSEERENIQGVGPSGNVCDKGVDSGFDLGTTGLKENSPRPSYVTLRPKKKEIE
ncbi:putative RNA recognition motif domain, nucleotide-binding alpha-beta plait domain superfamily [Helianthus annuus]|uniref:RNA recognition motif domain, nucleotide-binding alpha-beta plait domain superfamily n=1 Tax=Helianthus annuus TaxID=4232 RepID=A0A9K3NZA5_HELAN|nr:putative RNA recognition motif domain, nucleotide-binding alpha-beta plait domain superfamily [Helianthus annuus]KAJ0605103.1 putative RNA recognition motif domain, nucleotide-binding alpha-beta plait domain superfamily [Helianthus annuus]KAJ0777561.1 putative RNA recognition motif domain, nucleotide-binding alpha-beta plait domain superfamily [Helianthus annuus]KAJ0786595.1 putative RNA recognition motif domain, nucleotide-binding alpha-beta plait domain superfamily [Helianthus annuus]